MAITKIIKIKVNTKAAIQYVANPEKTNEGNLVSYVGCSSSNADINFDIALRNSIKNPKGEEVLAYHFLQSFSPDDNLTPEEAHKIGMEFMERTFGGKYAFVCSTHTDKNHIHNHFVMCAAERSMNGRKLNDDLSLLHKIQRTSDQLCAEHGLSVITNKRGRGKKYKEWLEDKQSPSGSKKTQLRKLIDKTIMESKDFDDFLERMKAQNVEIAFGHPKGMGRQTKYRPEGAKNFFRGHRLGTFYSDENIEKRIERRVAFLEKQEKAKEARAAARKARYDAMTPAERKLEKNKIKIKSIRDESDIDISRDNLALKRWTDKQNAMRMQQIISEVKASYGIDYTQIKGHLSELNVENERISRNMNSKKKDIEMLRDFIETCMTYKKLKIYATNMEKSDNPEKYYEEHDSQINAFNEASAILQNRNVDLENLTMDKIKKLQDTLKATEEELANLEEQKKQNEHEITELRSYQKEIDIYFGRKPEEEI